MAEYWISKKQYWCKYCNIFVRDDAPSKALHEGGGKHQGNKERFIRDIYKTGVRDKRAKEEEARTIAQIEAAAKTSHASKDGGEYAGRPVASRPAASGSSSRPPRPKPAGDKWANYSSAASLGFDDEETKLSSFEIEQMVRGRGTNVGEWEEVKEAAPAMTYTEDGVPALDLKRKAEEEEDHNNFKFQHRDKRPAHDVYDDDDWDPKAALGSIKLKTKEKKLGEAAPESKPAVKKEEATDKAGFSKVGWSGKLNMTEGDPVKEEPKDEGKDEGDSKPALDDVAEPTAESKVVEPATEIKTEAAAPETVAAAPEPAPSSGASMFKKRRPPPSSRKK